MPTKPAEVPVHSKVDRLKIMMKAGGVKRLLFYVRKQPNTGAMMYCAKVTGHNGDAVTMEYLTIDKRKGLEQWLQANAPSAAKTQQP